MGRVVGFFIGTVFGFIALRVLLTIGLFYLNGPDEAAAASRHQSVDEYRAGSAATDRQVDTLCVFGSLLCGVAGVLLLNRPVKYTDRNLRRLAGNGEQLTDEEFRQVLHACGWAPVERHGRQYLRGLAVGRLAEQHPALAKKVDELGDDEMAGLHSYLCRHRAREM
jgi:hypothetical protein